MKKQLFFEQKKVEVDWGEALKQIFAFGISTAILFLVISSMLAHKFDSLNFFQNLIFLLGFVISLLVVMAAATYSFFLILMQVNIITEKVLIKEEKICD